MEAPHVSSAAFGSVSRSGQDLEMQPLGIHGQETHDEPEFRSSLDETRLQHGMNEAEGGAPQTPTIGPEQGRVPTPSSIYGSEPGSLGSESSGVGAGGASQYGSMVGNPHDQPIGQSYNNNHDIVHNGDISANSRVFNNKNHGTVEVGHNNGLYLSTEAQQDSHEFMKLNSGNMTITHSNGSHTIDEHRTNSLNIDSLGEHGKVRINSMNGPAHQTLAPGTAMHFLHPNGITHETKGGSATFDQYGKQGLTKITGNILRNPAKFAAGAVTTVAGAGLLLNNNAALFSTIPIAIATIGKTLKGNG